MAQSNISQQALEKSMDALWLKMRVHTNNISNYETPDYKAKKVSFTEVMDTACAREKGSGNVSLRINVTEDSQTSSRIDGNNVDMESEQLELWRTQAQFAAIAQKISGKYRNISTVINAIR